MIANDGGRETEREGRVIANERGRESDSERERKGDRVESNSERKREGDRGKGEREIEIGRKRGEI